MGTTAGNFIGSLGSDADDAILTLLEHMIWPILAIVIIGVLVFVPQTFSSPVLAIKLMLWGAVPVGLLVLAESVALLSGNFDLSIGAIAGFSAMLTGMVIGTCPSCWGITHSALVGFVLIIAIGAIIGLINGVMIAIVGVNPFLQTLAFLIILIGARTSLNTQPVGGLPELYLVPGGKPFISIGFLLVTFVVLGILLRYTEFGQAVYAIGSDDHSAREVGINTNRVVVAVFMISGILSAIAGLMITGFTTVVPPLIGEGLVFRAFAGAVIGGISLFGGRGRVTGALGGILLIKLINSAIENSTIVSATDAQLINGIVLLIAILLYSAQDRIRSRILASR